MNAMAATMRRPTPVPRAFDSTEYGSVGIVNAHCRLVAPKVQHLRRRLHHQLQQYDEDDKSRSSF